MLYHQFAAPAPHADRPAMVTPQGVVSYARLRDMAVQLAHRLGSLSGERVALLLPAEAGGVAALAALDHLGCDTLLLDATLPASEAQRTAAQWGRSALLSPVGPLAAEWEVIHCDAMPGQGTAAAGRSDGSASDIPRPAGVTLLTSGTEGGPKAVRHTWQSLSRPVRRVAGGESQRWWLSYRIHLYAGLQVVLQTLWNHATLVAPAPQMGVDELLLFMEQAGVQYVSATPSYWRRLLLLGAPQQWPRLELRQITLGGEPVDQPLLDHLRRLFPAARLVHIYATTELGRCFSVSDGKAGFPAAYLAQPTADGVELRVVDGQLEVRSSNAMQGYEVSAGAAGEVDGGRLSGGWFPTGDLVELAGQRVLFAGRRGDMINVGGNKVQPVVVERVIRTVPGVADARVYGKRSSLAGQIVACQLVAQPGVDPECLKRQVAERCRAELAAFQCPRWFELVSAIELSPAGKSRRSE